MSTYVTPGESIAAGNNNAAGLTLVTALSVPAAIPFLEVTSIGNWQRGLAKVPAGTSVRKFTGFQSVEWISSLLWLQQWEYLKDTFEGQVTIRTLTDDDDTYANYNAVFYCGQLTDYEKVRVGQYGKAILNFRWIFSRLEAL